MNSEIPPSTTIAPIAITIADVPLSPLAPPDVVEVAVTVGVAVVVGAGVDTLGCGKPGWSGFDPGDCASAAGGSTSADPATAAVAGGSASATPARTAKTTRSTDLKPRPSPRP